MSSGDSDPYRPPEAAVADPFSAIDRAPAPAQARRALRFLVTALVLDTISELPGIRGPIPEAEDLPPGLYYGVFAVFALLYATLIVLLAKRHDWARWATFAFLLIGWVGFLVYLAEEITSAPLAALLNAVVCVLETWACVLLFTPPSARWFRRDAPEEPERA
jgi:hypothetical protein